MPNILQDGKGQKTVVYSLCADLSYAQAEVLLISEEIKKADPLAQIIGHAEQGSPMSVEKFAAAYSQNPKDWKRLEEIRAEVVSKGFESFIIKPYPDDLRKLLTQNPKIAVGRCLEELADAMIEAKTADPDLIEDLYCNPLHAGVHCDFKATASEELWVKDAVQAIRRTSAERWIRRMLANLRFYFKGVPLTPLPNKNDRCPCNSTKKYGKCCGYGVEHEDPADCKLGLHQYTAWYRNNGKFVRSCERCFRVHEAPWTEETVFEGIKLTIVGCRACGNHPTPEDLHKEVGQALSWHACGCCGKNFTIESMLIEHEFSDGKHSDHWVATEVAHKEPALDLESKAFGKGIFVHKECFMKALPAWPKLSKPVYMNPKAEIARDITG